MWQSDSLKAGLCEESTRVNGLIQLMLNLVNSLLAEAQ